MKNNFCRNCRPLAGKISLAWLLAAAIAFALAGHCRVIVNARDNYGNRVQADQVRLTTDGIATEVQQDKASQTTCGPHNHR